MEKNEYLTSKEILNHASSKEDFTDSELTREDAEIVFTERTQMLNSIKSALSPKLREALLIKIEHEKKSLLEMVADDEKDRETHKKRNKILDYTFFKKKSLNMKRI